MSNILVLPIFDGAATSFQINRGADWVDNIYFAQPGYGPPAAIAACSLTINLNTITIPATPGTAGLAPGVQVAPIAGVHPGGFIGAISSATVVTVVDRNGDAANATATSTAATVTFNPPPLDLSGIKFISNIRVRAGATQSLLTARTSDGTILNGTLSGLLTFNVPQPKVFGVPAGIYVVDLLAVGDGHVIDLLPTPATMTVNDIVSDSALL